MQTEKRHAMEHYDNEQRLRILQERLWQIKNKQEAKHDEQPKVDNTPPYPTYNPKATQSSNEDIAPEQTEKEKTPSTYPWKRIFTLLIIGGLAYGGFYLYENFDFASLIHKTTNSEAIVEQEVLVPLQYSLDFGEAKHLIMIGDFEDENLAKSLVEQKNTEGYTANYFFLPSVSNSKEQIYKVYIGPFESHGQAKQWAGTLEGESEILNL